ncbi:MAG: ABC transporter permease, partial [Clostridia bacterium]|nr:ABC transporter permease [Clostridia bacterium]
MTAEEKKSLNRERIKHLITGNLPLLGLIVIIIVFQILTEGKLLSQRNVNSLINQTFLLMIACVGSIFIFLQGGCDLSLTSGIGTCAIAGAFALNAYGVGACIAAMLATGLVLGLFNGFIYSRTKINPFILSLSVNLLLDGLNYTFTDQLAVIQIARKYQKAFGTLELKIAVLIIFSLIVYYFYDYTIVGKHSRAV